MTNSNKLDNLLEGDKEIFLEVFSKVSQGTATYQDLSEIMRIAQQNARVFDAFDLAVILRIAELHFREPENIKYGYVKENLRSAFGIM
ncbi:hypothetical protein PPOLYM_02537 [Paenibacillus polymyxa]|uniref:hypothetical protein n=1 Tax=Paenibacillus polymyxa TaxID=1406 RepID=UPI00094740C2|nr:hypothetical protein [Paenibacillus polymyxa]APQ59834.1 hypothetical protein VK72_14520 [Paenibacillus polymyxa]VUG06144.1 hypothetical protein PPOLYM_02537 [Paenibacillus polymyxa]